MLGSRPGVLKLHLRSQSETSAHDHWRVQHIPTEWLANETALVIIDMWDGAQPRIDRTPDHPIAI